MALIVAMAIFLSVSAYAQSDETCIAYMEADAEYESSVNGDKDVGESAWAYVLAVNASNSAVKDSEHRRNPILASEEKIASDLHEARRALREREKTWEKVLRRLEARGKARKAYEESVAAARAKFLPIRDAAYRSAYAGPESDVASVMDKLIAADRERCRRRLE